MSKDEDIPEGLERVPGTPFPTYVGSFTMTLSKESAEELAESLDPEELKDDIEQIRKHVAEQMGWDPEDVEVEEHSVPEEFEEGSETYRIIGRGDFG